MKAVLKGTVFLYNCTKGSDKMKTLFLEQSKRENIAKIMFQKVYLDRDKIIIHSKLENVKIEQKAKIAKRIKEILIKDKCKQKAIKKRLKQDRELMNLLYGLNINICSSKWLFKNSTNEIIQEILNDKSKQEIEIYICVNEIDSQVEEYIYKFAKEFKRINIITNNIGKFKNIENKLYAEDGILITITNNKRKSLSKANIILNIDFPKEILNQFIINHNATIITWEDDIKILKKSFCGKIISDIDYKFKSEDKVAIFAQQNNLDGYDLRDICQVINYKPTIINFQL